MEAQSAGSKSKLGIIGLILSILGCVILLSSLLLVVFMVGAGGGLDIMDYPIVELGFVMCGGFFLGVIGGTLGVVSLIRGESKIASGIAIILGVIILGAGVLLTLLNYRAQRILKTFLSKDRKSSNECWTFLLRVDNNPTKRTNSG